MVRQKTRAQGGTRPITGHSVSLISFKFPSPFNVDPLGTKLPTQEPLEDKLKP